MEIFPLILIAVIVISGEVILNVNVCTWNKFDSEFSIHINKQLVQESTFDESPAFTIWLEYPNIFLSIFLDAVVNFQTELKPILRVKRNLIFFEIKRVFA